MSKELHRPVEDFLAHVSQNFYTIGEDSVDEHIGGMEDFEQGGYAEECLTKAAHMDIFVEDVRRGLEACGGGENSLYDLNIGTRSNVMTMRMDWYLLERWEEILESRNVDLEYFDEVEVGARMEFPQ